MSIDVHTQVVTHAIAKKLKEIGLKQESFFYYVQSQPTEFNPKPVPGIIYRDYLSHDLLAQCFDHCSAFTAGELAPMMFGWFDLNKHAQKDMTEWALYFQPENGTDNSYCFNDKRLAEVMGKMLIAQHSEGELDI